MFLQCKIVVLVYTLNTFKSKNINNNIINNNNYNNNNNNSSSVQKGRLSGKFVNQGSGVNPLK